MTQIILSTILGLCGGGAVFAFIQFLISRHDEKSGKYKSITDAIESQRQELDRFIQRYAEDQANEARTRILRFSDEILHKQRHSKESFDQIHADIDQYRDYCEQHPEYKNNRAVLSISNIERIYAECMEKHDFLDG